MVFFFLCSEKGRKHCQYYTKKGTKNHLGKPTNHILDYKQTSLYCTLQILHFLQIEHLLQPCVVR